jgi:hypothetical protein
MPGYESTGRSAHAVAAHADLPGQGEIGSLEANDASATGSRAGSALALSAVPIRNPTEIATSANRRIS